MALFFCFDRHLIARGPTQCGPLDQRQAGVVASLRAELFGLTCLSSVVAQTGSESLALTGSRITSLSMVLLVENVQSYPRPPALEPVEQRICVMLGGQVMADTTAALRVLETHHAPSYYIPRADVVGDVSPAAGTSFCEWKGRAAYWTLSAGPVRAEAACWSYPSPTPRFAPLKDYMAFYAGRMEACFVGSVQVQPQPGDFYGGWVTPNLTGQIKGAPETRHW